MDVDSYRNWVFVARNYLTNYLVTKKYLRFFKIRHTLPRTRGDCLILFEEFFEAYGQEFTSEMEC